MSYGRWWSGDDGVGVGIREDDWFRCKTISHWARRTGYSDDSMILVGANNDTTTAATTAYEQSLEQKDSL